MLKNTSFPQIKRAIWNADSEVLSRDVGVPKQYKLRITLLLALLMSTTNVIIFWIINKMTGRTFASEYKKLTLTLWKVIDAFIIAEIV